MPTTLRPVTRDNAPAMSPSPVRAMSAVERTDTTSVVARWTLRSRIPVTVMPGIATSTPSSDAPSDASVASEGACARAEPADSAVVTSRVSQMSGFNMLVPRDAGNQSGGSDVQAVAAVSKVAVAELHVQPAYQVSVEPLTAPT